MRISEVTPVSAIKSQNANATITTALEAAAITQGPPVGFVNHLTVCTAPHVSENRQNCIAEAAYFNAERRGFAPGHELDDWFAAENEINPRLAG